MMVQATHLPYFDHVSLGRWLRSSWFWSVFVERQMGAPAMVIVCIRRKVPMQRSLAEHDHVIQALAADRADQPFDVSPLPRRPGRRQDLLNALRFHLVHELLAEDPVAVAKQGGFARCCAVHSAWMRRPPKWGCAAANTYKTWNRTVGTVKKSTETMFLTWLSRNVRQVWEGGSRRRTMYLATVGSVISMPSFSNSP